MSGSGYYDSCQYMYFKADVYSQNNTEDEDGYIQVTFYNKESYH